MAAAAAFVTAAAVLGIVAYMSYKVGFSEGKFDEQRMPTLTPPLTEANPNLGEAGRIESDLPSDRHENR